MSLYNHHANLTPARLESEEKKAGLEGRLRDLEEENAHLKEELDYLRRDRKKERQERDTKVLAAPWRAR